MRAVACTYPKHKVSSPFFACPVLCEPIERAELEKPMPIERSELEKAMAKLELEKQQLIELTAAAEADGAIDDTEAKQIQKETMDVQVAEARLKAAARRAMAARGHCRRPGSLEGSSAMMRLRAPTGLRRPPPHIPRDLPWRPRAARTPPAASRVGGCVGSFYAGDVSFPHTGGSRVTFEPGFPGLSALSGHGGSGESILGFSFQRKQGKETCVLDLLRFMMFHSGRGRTYRVWNPSRCQGTPLPEFFSFGAWPAQKRHAS